MTIVLQRVVTRSAINDFKPNQELCAVSPKYGIFMRMKAQVV